MIRIKDIIRWERLRNKSFQDIDSTNEEDMHTLMYVTSDESEKYTIQVYVKSLTNKKLLKQEIVRIEKEMALTGQYRKNTDGSDEASAGKNESIRISDIAAILISSGMDAGYVMNEMELYELDMYVTAYERKRREEMDMWRMSIWYNLLPHVGKGKLKRPQELFTFAWETAEEKKRAEKQMRDNAETLKKFLSGEMFDINKYNWKKRTR